MPVFDPKKCAIISRNSHFFMLSTHSNVPIDVHGRVFNTALALHLATAFPDRPDIQEEIRLASYPEDASRIATYNRASIRTDWGAYAIPAMYWVLATRFEQNKPLMSNIYNDTFRYDRIVFKYRDAIFGVTETSDGMLQGTNVLGELHCEIRDRNFGVTAEIRKLATNHAGIPVPEETILFEQEISGLLLCTAYRAETLKSKLFPHRVITDREKHRHPQECDLGGRGVLAFAYFPRHDVSYEQMMTVDPTARWCDGRHLTNGSQFCFREERDAVYYKARGSRPHSSEEV